VNENEQRTTSVAEIAAPCVALVSQSAASVSDKLVYAMILSGDFFYRSRLPQ